MPKSKPEQMSFNFEGHSALVSGGGGAIGSALVKALDDAGAKVYAVDVHEEGLANLAKECTNVEVKTCDLCDEADVDSLKDWVKDPTLCVHAAAIFEPSKLLDLTSKHFDTTMNVNIRGSALFLREASRMIAETGKGGAIVNVSTQGSKVGLRNHFAYCASKGALDQMTRVMALELTEHGIRTNSVHPTVTKTSMGAYWQDERQQNMINRIPLGRLGEISDVVWPVMYLLSDASSMINGETIAIDGGFLAAPWGRNQE